MNKDKKIHLDFVTSKGIDLVINSRPVTKEEELEISKYIRAYKAKHTKKQISAKRTKSTKTSRMKFIS